MTYSQTVKRAAGKAAVWMMVGILVGLALQPNRGLHAQDGTACEVASGANVNRRAGPGTNFTILGTLPPGWWGVKVQGQAEGNDGYIWWLLEDDSWVRSDVVQAGGDCSAVPGVLGAGTAADEARQAYFAGMALYGQGNYEEALPLLELARDGYGQAQVTDLEAATLLPLAMIYQTLGAGDQARTALENALTLWTALDDTSGQAIALIALGELARAQNDPNQAIVSYQDALDLQQIRGDRGGQAVILLAMGQIYFENGYATEALDYFQRALPIWFEISSRGNAARTLQAIGDVHVAQEQYADAVTQYGQALSLWQSIGNKQSEAETLLGLSQAFSGLGDGERAATYDAQAQILLAAATPDSNPTSTD